MATQGHRIFHSPDRHPALRRSGHFQIEARTQSSDPPPDSGSSFTFDSRCLCGELANHQWALHDTCCYPPENIARMTVMGVLPRTWTQVTERCKRFDLMNWW
ncbi:uncharacterized protein [Littorina saxatilis]|uniref:uncharacterized protein n=1 Tax=Littorina saxatilis TaxID=31220 RepID=UPI0038B5819E